MHTQTLWGVGGKFGVGLFLGNFGSLDQELGLQKAVVGVGRGRLGYIITRPGQQQFAVIVSPSSLLKS